MKTIKNFLVIFLISFAALTMVGCNFNFNPGNGDPIWVDEDDPTGITITNPTNNYKLFIGDTLQLSAKVIPIDKADQSVTWSSNNDAIAAVDENGLVRAIGEGKVKITATSKVAPTILAYLYLTVEEKTDELLSLEIIGPNELFVEETIKLNYQKTPLNALETVIWSSSDLDIATVDSNGRVIGVSEGIVTITLTAENNISTSFPLTVKPRSGNPTELFVIGRTQVDINQTIRLVANVLPIGSINTVNWTSSNEEIAIVDQTGRVSGISSGIVEITATSSVANVAKSFTIEVIDNRIDTSNLQQNVIDVISQTKNSILGVSHYLYNPLTQKYEKKSIGSGVVYKAWFEMNDGSIVNDLEDIITFADVKKYCYYLITNRHVVVGSDKVKIYLHEEEIEIDATLMQYDDKVDLAVVYFEYSRYIKPLELADSSLLNSGQFAIAIGNPSGYQYSSSATFGIISYPKRYISDDTDSDGVNDWDAEYIQHDVAINPGNSGGPLLDLYGRIIGINTLKFAATEIDSMGFSIPSNVVKGLVEILEEGRKPVRALIGVTVIEVRALLEKPDEKYPVPEEVTTGIYVLSVGPNSVAQRGGVLEKDIILSFNDVKLTSSLMLRTELGKIVVGSNTEVDIEVYRNGEIITLTLIF